MAWLRKLWCFFDNTVSRRSELTNEDESPFVFVLYNEKENLCTIKKLYYFPMCRQTKNRPSDWISSLHTVPNDKLESGTCSAMKNPGQEVRLHPTRSKSSGRLNSSSGCQAAAPSTLSMSPSNCRVDPFHCPPTIHCPRSGRIYLLLYPFHHPSPCKETHDLSFSFWCTGRRRCAYAHESPTCLCALVQRVSCVQ